MKMFTGLFRKTFLVFACVIAGLTQSNAAIYTAISSGNYNDPSTWIGGQVPPSTLLADAVIIPDNITVTLNVNQTLNGSLSTIDIDGTLNSSGNSALILTLGSLRGDGLINIDSLVLGASLGVSFTGNIIVNNLTSLGTTLSSSADITVNGRVHLLDGLLNLTAGIVNLGSNVTIIKSGGDMDVNGGIANLGGLYNLVYRDQGTTTGWELLQAGLNNVEIDVPGVAEVTLDADLKVNGLLNLKSGILKLNGHDLVLLGGGKLNEQSNGLIHADANADIHLLSNNSLGGALNFAPNGNIVHDLIVDLGSGSDSAGINANLKVEGVLNLKTGLLNMHDHILTVNGSVLGGSDNSYVVTGEDGLLSLNINVGGPNLFPIGSMDHYLPVKLSPASGSGIVGVGAGADVFVNGSNGPTLGNQPMVDGIWHIVNSTALDLTANLMWTNEAEINGFDRGTCYISQLLSGKWSQGVIGSAIPSVNGTVGLTIGNLISTDAVLAVFDRDAVTTSIPDIEEATAYRLFPNPASGQISIQANGIQRANVAITDMNGRIVLSQQNIQFGGQPYQLDIRSLNAGNYFITIEDGRQSYLSRFTVDAAGR